MAQKTKKIFLHTTIILGSLLVLSIVVFVYHKAEQAKADQFLPSDLNQDGIVDAKDIDLIKNNYANTAGGILSPSPYDLNNDRKINALDLAVVEDNMGNGTDPSRDWDKDGFTAGGGDCNDRNKDINPRAKELANSVDDNCNGNVDELANYVPISSKDFYKIGLHFKYNGNTPTLSVANVSTGTRDTESTGPRGFGSYVANLYDSNNQVVDYVLFSLNDTVTVLSSKSGKDLPRQISKNEGDFNIEVPKSSNVAKIVINKVDDSGVNIPVSLTSASLLGKDAKATTPPPSNCPPGMNADAQGHYGFFYCDNFTAEDNYIIPMMRDIYSHWLEIMWFSMPKIRFLTPEQMQEVCGGADLTQCAQRDEYDILIGTQIEEHDLVHVFYLKLYDAIMSHPNIYLNYDPRAYSDFEQLLLATQCNGITAYCNPLLSNLRDYWVRFQNGCDQALYIDCYGDKGLVWKDPYDKDPVSGAHDEEGPRPGLPGTLRPFGVVSSATRWADLMDEIWQIKKSHSSSKLKDLLKSDSRYRTVSPGVQDLLMDTTNLGNNGLFQDWDHDGIPDQIDNCDPSTHQVCTDDTTKCQNSDQSDINPKNGLGDKCEHIGEIASYCGKDLHCLDGYNQPARDTSGNLLCPDLKQVYVPFDECTALYLGQPGYEQWTCPINRDFWEFHYRSDECVEGTTHYTQVAGVCGSAHGGTTTDCSISPPGFTNF